MSACRLILAWIALCAVSFSVAWMFHGKGDGTQLPDLRVIPSVELRESFGYTDSKCGDGPRSPF